MALLNKVKQAVRGRSEKVEQGIDKAVRQVDQRTGGKYRDKLDKGAEAVKRRTRDLDDQRRDRPAGGPDAPPVTDQRDAGPGGPPAV